jgi:hypothetical protein
MKITAIFAAAAALAVISGPGLADDHLVQAAQAGGLTFEVATATTMNKSGKVIPDTAPGQGSPFAGNDQCTPATDTGAAQDHANVKPKGADACTED